MKELEPIYIRIAECGTCVNNEDGNFDELMEQVLSDVLQIEKQLKCAERKYWWGNDNNLFVLRKSAENGKK